MTKEINPYERRMEFKNVIIVLRTIPVNDLTLGEKDAHLTVTSKQAIKFLLINEYHQLKISFYEFLLRKINKIFRLNQRKL
jgi:hypothetical protein